MPILWDYTGWAKKHQTHGHNSVKSYRIFIILSLAHSLVNLHYVCMCCLFAGWLKIKYPTGEYAISLQPMV